MSVVHVQHASDPMDLHLLKDFLKRDGSPPCYVACDTPMPLLCVTPHPTAL